MGSATMPTRIKKVPATANEASVPYLRPYDVFEYLPPESDRVSRDRTKNIDHYLIRPNDILQTRSGRNLGPVTLADDYLARFAVSDDMIRIRIHDEPQRLYTFAFLRSVTGQRVLRGDLGGSVISHISPEQVGAIGIPFVEELLDQVVGPVRRALGLRASARSLLHSTVSQVNARFPVPDHDRARGWTTRTAALSDRLDAAFHSKSVIEAKALLRQGARMGDLAEIVKPSGRHKMVYVDRAHGTPFLSGRQILQSDVVAPKYLSPFSAQSAGGFNLVRDTIVFQADGRAGEGLGYPAMITSDREGWLASGHVGRLIPRSPRDVGWLWAAMASDIVQTQIAALSCGSVVDALYPEDLKEVLLPPCDAVRFSTVTTAWEHMAEASRLLDQASAIIDSALDDSRDLSV